MCVRPYVWLEVDTQTGVMERHGAHSLALQNIILHHRSCQPDGRCSGMGIAHSNEVKCAPMMDGHARESSRVYVCARHWGDSSLLLLSISQPMKADHPDFVRRSQEEMLNYKRWSDTRQKTL